MAIDNVIATVAQVRGFKAGEPINSATSFWYGHNDELFLITNRHVVINEKEKHFPDELRLLLHTDRKNTRNNAEFAISLYSDGKPLWREHPASGSKVDVVAIPIVKNEVTSQFVIKALSEKMHIPSDVNVTIGADVQVIGYPLGFHDDVHNLPIIRNAAVASVYPVPFQGQPFVLIDARLHRGTSGSPVMTKPTSTISRTGGLGISSGSVSFFMGVHSAVVDIPGRDPNVDEPLGLSLVWFASLIPEIIEGSSMKEKA